MTSTNSAQTTQAPVLTPTLVNEPIPPTKLHSATIVSNVSSQHIHVQQEQITTTMNIDTCSVLAWDRRYTPYSPEPPFQQEHHQELEHLQEPLQHALENAALQFHTVDNNMLQLSDNTITNANSLQSFNHLNHNCEHCYQSNQLLIDSISSSMQAFQNNHQHQQEHQQHTTLPSSIAPIPPIDFHVSMCYNTLVQQYAALIPPRPTSLTVPFASPTPSPITITIRNARRQAWVKIDEIQRLYSLPYKFLLNIRVNTNHQGNHCTTNWKQFMAQLRGSESRHDQREFKFLLFRDMDKTIIEEGVVAAEKHMPKDSWLQHEMIISQEEGAEDDGGNGLDMQQDLEFEFNLHLTTTSHKNSQSKFILAIVAVFNTADALVSQQHDLQKQQQYVLYISEAKMVYSRRRLNKSQFIQYNPPQAMVSSRRAEASGNSSQVATNVSRNTGFRPKALRVKNKF